MQIISLGYCLIILLGTILLSLPIAVRDRSDISVMTSFFTATSATCVTGLVHADTYLHWTLFGQGVILMLIQIGGIGFMTLCISFLSITKRKISFSSRNLMQNSISAPQVGGIVRMTHFIFLGTFIVELIGAFFLAFYFCPKLGLARGIWFALFHSISAFCNAGFDLMGSVEELSSLTTLVGNYYVNIVIMLLIIIGGLGFFVWHDVIDKKLKFSRYNLHSKIVLTVSGLLILLGAIIIFVIEHNTLAFENLNGGEQVLASFFQSVTTRTAGFNTINFSNMSDAGVLVLICLMLIGGSPGSTAGGIKTTTIAILYLSITTTFRKKKSTELFGRRMEEGITRTVACIFMLYLSLALIATIIISRVDSIPLMEALFESISAIATVGLTMGITPELSNVSSIVLTILMIFGRAGSLTILMAFASERNHVVSTLPLEKVQIG